MSAASFLQDCKPKEESKTTMLNAKWMIDDFMMFIFSCY
jgi:hypothetical protein